MAEANVPVHPLVQKALGAGEDPQPSPWIQLIGYVGPSKKAGNIRLYLGLDFQSYYEIPQSDIGPVAPVDRQDENSPTLLHVKASAVVDFVQVSKQTGPASYLVGPIAGEHMAAATAPGTPVNYLRPETRHTACPIYGPCGGPRAQELVKAPYPVSVFCPTYSIPCQTHLCPTPRPPCGRLPEQAAQEAVHPNYLTQHPCYFTQYGCTHNILCRPTPGTGGICTNYPHGQLC